MSTLPRPGPPAAGRRSGGLGFRAALALVGLLGVAAAPAQTGATPAVPASPVAASAPPIVATPLPYPAAVAARFVEPPQHYDTPGLQAGRSTATSNEELEAALRALAARGGAQRIDLGRSGAGAALSALWFTRGPGRPVVLLLGQQHGNEPAGAEALLVVAQRLADAAAPLAALLEHIDVLVWPRVNPDGALIGRRTNAAGLDVNRDHLLLRTAEAQAVAALFRRFRPVLVIDAHEHIALGRYLPKFGAIKRHDLLLQYATTPNLAPAIDAAALGWFDPPLRAALHSAGLTVDWYHTNPTAPDDRRLSMGGLRPDLARNAGGLRHAVSVLLESRGLDLGRLRLERRVHTHVVAIEALLRAASERPAALQRLYEDAGAALAARACRGRVALEAQPSLERRVVLMLDPVSGADTPVEVEWASALRMTALRERARPCGYWLAAGETAVVARLQALGLQVRTLSAPAELAVERFREIARGEGARTDVLGRIQDPDRVRRVVVALEPGLLSAPPGSHYVGLDQPLAELAVAALEPDTQDSFFAHGLLTELDRVARVSAPPPPPSRRVAPAPPLEPLPAPTPPPTR
ncbi:MAG: M14 family metallocarboxypeptidase [Rubrivivax sp.]